MTSEAEANVNLFLHLCGRRGTPNWLVVKSQLQIVVSGEVVAMARGPQKRNRVQAQKPHVALYSLKPSAKPKPKPLPKPISNRKFVVHNGFARGQWTKELMQTTI